MYIHSTKISFCAVPHFKSNKYSKDDFLNNAAQLHETDIIEKSAREVVKTDSEVNRILYSSGRIFEKAGAYDIAKEFYERLNHKNLYNRKNEYVNFDINRVLEKENAISERSKEC